uniref:Uncharacterized protein n=1 Tax=Rhizophora mucronata TaxID=61149 RepID=A0A2P2PSH1_RHIMU
MFWFHNERQVQGINWPQIIIHTLIFSTVQLLSSLPM